MSRSVRCARRLVAQAEKRLGDDDFFGFEYFEILSTSELDFAPRCESTAMWSRARDEIVLNLPSTVERATPNVFADQDRVMSRNLSRRGGRGAICTRTMTAARAWRRPSWLLAGADYRGLPAGPGRAHRQRRPALGLNLFARVSIRIEVDAIRRTVEYCTQMETPSRSTSANLVYTELPPPAPDAIKASPPARCRRGRRR